MKQYNKQTMFRTEGRPILSFLITIPMALILFIMLTGGRDVFGSIETRFSFAVVWALDTYLFYSMLRTGKTDRFRSILFSIFAVTLSFTFISNLVEMRGSMALSEADILQCKVPFCHIVTTMVLIPAAISKSIIFPGQIVGSHASISMMLIIVFGCLLILGRGFCSWGCFFGGWDDATSRFRNKAKWKNPPQYLRLGGYAVLLIAAISSAALLSPTYCEWACPFKAVTEFEAVTSIETAFKTVAFASLFGGLVIVAPILTKKRTQCAWFCPMGALCSFSNPISPFQIRIDTPKCVNCKKCIQACPVQALDLESLKKGKPHIQCLKCGKCVDSCPTSAISFHVRMTQLFKHPTTSRTLFLYASFAFLAIFSGGAIQRSILMILNLFATGKIQP